MEDYPRSLRELESRFSTEEACREYLTRLRWPDGEICPGCGGSRGWQTSRGLWMCASCGQQVSVTAGTIFQDTRSPLTVWFRAIWWVVSQKNVRVRWVSSVFWAWVAIVRLGRGSTRSGAR